MDNRPRPCVSENFPVWESLCTVFCFSSWGTKAIWIEGREASTAGVERKQTSSSSDSVSVCCWQGSYSWEWDTVVCVCLYLPSPQAKEVFLPSAIRLRVNSFWGALDLARLMPTFQVTTLLVHTVASGLSVSLPRYTCSLWKIRRKATVVVVWYVITSQMHYPSV